MFQPQFLSDREKVMVDGHGSDERRRCGGGNSDNGGRVVTATKASLLSGMKECRHPRPSVFCE